MCTGKHGLYIMFEFLLAFNELSITESTIKFWLFVFMLDFFSFVPIQWIKTISNRFHHFVPLLCCYTTVTTFYLCLFQVRMKFSCCLMQSAIFDLFWQIILHFVMSSLDGLLYIFCSWQYELCSLLKVLRCPI